jgi:hypothetical protein
MGESAHSSKRGGNPAAREHCWASQQWCPPRLDLSHPVDRDVSLSVSEKRTYHYRALVASSEMISIAAKTLWGG